MRNSLSFVYDTQAEPPVRRGIIRAFLHNKSRDLAVALVVVVLLLANTLLSAGIVLMRARGATLTPPWSLLLGELGRFLTLGLELVFSVSLFYVLYRFAATRRLSDPALVVGAVFSALGFELAKRLFGLYVARTMITTTQWTGAQLRGAHRVRALGVLHGHRLPARRGGGGTVEARRLQRRQRALLA